jgi:formylglycine-generating enzyme required for sulfatase activity
MTLVPGGAFIMGKSDDDLADIQDAPTKTVTVRSFIWMKPKSLTVSTNS